VEKGEWSARISLHNRPHAWLNITGDWSVGYSRPGRFFRAWVRRTSFWPSVNPDRNVYGDRNLFCPPRSSYEE